MNKTINFLFLIGISLSTPSYASFFDGSYIEGEFIRGGDFDLGLVDLDIERFPKYPRRLPSSLPWIKRSPNEEGGSSLVLPYITDGGYVLSWNTFGLLPGKEYTVSYRVRSNKKPKITLEIDSGGWRKVARKDTRLTNGFGEVELTFIAGRTPISSDGRVPHMLRLRTKGEGDISLESISLKGPIKQEHLIKQPSVWVEPEEFPGIYGLGAEGDFTISVEAGYRGVVNYRIVDAYDGSVVMSNRFSKHTNVGVERKRLSVPTDKRGIYRVDAWIASPDSASSRHYVVIKSGNPGPKDSRFAIAAEEHGYISMANAFYNGEDMYRLADDIGISGVRIFAPLMPSELSVDGKRFSFSSADTVVALTKKYNLQTMAVLGNNDMFLTPEWLKTDKQSKDSFNISEGIKVEKKKKKFRKKGGMEYFDLSAYKKYLEAVFNHFKGNIDAYEIWNEPIRKFAFKDYAALVNLTSETLREIDPEAHLVGFSSSNDWSENGKGKVTGHKLMLMERAKESDLFNKIDVLSYHSRHSFRYYGLDYDQRNFDTGFENKLQESLEENSASFKLWNTEIGLPWQSGHDNRLDFNNREEKENFFLDWDLDDAVRQMPMVYASAAANNVEKVFWFSLDSSISSIPFTRKRWTLFDGQLEPTGFIPAFDAMTEIIGNASFDRLEEDANGSKVYIFSKKSDSILVAYNWKEKATSIILPSINCEAVIYNLYGSPDDTGSRCDAGEVYLDKNPIYLVIENINPGELKINFSQF